MRGPGSTLALGHPGAGASTTRGRADLSSGTATCGADLSSGTSTRAARTTRAGGRSAVASIAIGHDGSRMRTDGAKRTAAMHTRTAFMAGERGRRGPTYTLRETARLW